MTKKLRKVKTIVLQIEDGSKLDFMDGIEDKVSEAQDTIQDEISEILNEHGLTLIDMSLYDR